MAAKKSVKKKGAYRPPPTPPKKAFKKAAKKAGPKKKVARKPNSSFMAPLMPSPLLAQIIGPKPIPRTEMVKKIWDYIKKNGLQDKNNKKMINNDQKLRAVSGGKRQVSMFEIARIIAKNVK